jgi:hypothetical protein
VGVNDTSYRGIIWGAISSYASRGDYIRSTSNPSAKASSKFARIGAV